MTSRTRDQHLFDEGPKRILALDGGGVRGALTLGYLAEIERVLGERHGDPENFVLSDYFDLIGGTSTGSIIAAGLSLGWRVETLQTLYADLSNSVFDKPRWRFGIFVSKFPTKKIDAALQTHLGEVCLGDDEIRTGLMVMTKRLDTGSPWPLHNNPRGRYFEARPGSDAVPNKDYLLRRIVRASTAAPHYFEPESLPVSEGMIGGFVDGGVSMSNNPALQLFLMATLKGFCFNWPRGADRLLLVSVGTGYSSVQMAQGRVNDLPALGVAMRALGSLMDDATWLGQTMLQLMSNSATPWEIDREIGTLDKDALTDAPLLTYLRYNLQLDAVWLEKELGLDVEPEELIGLGRMDDASHVTALSALGADAAPRQIRPDHFPAAFDLPAA